MEVSISLQEKQIVRYSLLHIKSIWLVRENNIVAFSILISQANIKIPTREKGKSFYSYIYCVKDSVVMVLAADGRERRASDFTSVR